MWVWFAPIVMHAVCSDGSWFRWWVWICGSVKHALGGGMGLDRGDWWVFSVEIGEFGLVEIGGFLGLDWCCCGRC